MFGLSGVITILKSLVSGQAQNELEFTEAPNMPFLYWLAVASAILKKKWTSEKQWPKLKVGLYSFCSHWNSTMFARILIASAQRLSKVPRCPLAAAVVTA